MCTWLEYFGKGMGKSLSCPIQLSYVQVLAAELFHVWLVELFCCSFWGGGGEREGGGSDFC